MNQQPDDRRTLTRSLRGFAASYPHWSARAVIALAAAIFAGVFAVRTLDGSPEDGVHLIYIVPVILLALRFGVRGGLFGASVAIGLFVAWTVFFESELRAVTWISPMITVLAVGLMVGLLSESYSESEQRFRSAVENLLEPFALFTAIRDDRGAIYDFRCDFANAAAAESIRLRRDQMVGGRLSTLFPGGLEQKLMLRYANVVETGRPIFREAEDYVTDRDGQTLARAFDIRVSKLGDGVEVTWRDITERKRLAQQRDWSAAIVKHSSDAILSVDRRGNVMSWSDSAERLYGYTAAEAIGSSARTLFGEHDIDARERCMARALDGARPGPTSHVDCHKDGRKLAVTCDYWPILDDAGVVIGAARSVRLRSATDQPEERSISSTR